MEEKPIFMSFQERRVNVSKSIQYVNHGVDKEEYVVEIRLLIREGSKEWEEYSCEKHFECVKVTSLIPQSFKDKILSVRATGAAESFVNNSIQF